MKKKRQNKRLLGALALGMLAVSGMAIAAASTDSSNINNNSIGSFKEIKSNPMSFIKSEGISLENNFDYINEMNREFSENYSDNEQFSYFGGDSIKEIEKQNEKDKE